MFLWSPVTFPILQQQRGGSKCPTQCPPGKNGIPVRLSLSLSFSVYQFKFFPCIKRDVDKLILFKRENKEFPVFPANQEPPDKMDFREKEDRQEKTETTYEWI